MLLTVRKLQKKKIMSDIIQIMGIILKLVTIDAFQIFSTSYNYLFSMTYNWIHLILVKICCIQEYKNNIIAMFQNIIPWTYVQVWITN